MFPYRYHSSTTSGLANSILRTGGLSQIFMGVFFTFAAVSFGWHRSFRPQL
jgi:hypothetical protein